MMLLNTCMSLWIHNCQLYFLRFYRTESLWSSTSFILFVENASRLLSNINTSFYEQFGHHVWISRFVMRSSGSLVFLTQIGTETKNRPL